MDSIIRLPSSTDDATPHFVNFWLKLIACKPFVNAFLTTPAINQARTINKIAPNNLGSTPTNDNQILSNEFVNPFMMNSPLHLLSLDL